MRKERNDDYILHKKIERGAAEMQSLSFYVHCQEKNDHHQVNTPHKPGGNDLKKILFIGGAIWKLPL